MSTTASVSRFRIEDFEAAIFDLDGVLADTANLHFEAWKQMFDEYLKERFGPGFAPFSKSEYLSWVDGKPREEGIRSFLKSRGIELPEKAQREERSVASLARRKNEAYRSYLREGQLRAFPDAIEFVEACREYGLKTAVVSSSKNCQAVLEEVGIKDLFDVRLDGMDLECGKLHDKPAPDLYVEAASRSGASPLQVVVFEDAVSGIKAARAGELGAVIGVARERDGAELASAGADLVINNFKQLGFDHTVSALRAMTCILSKLRGTEPALFLDYDGTLTPIVERPEDAYLSESMRQSLERIAKYCPVAVMSGRDLVDVRDRVGIEGLYYGGSHGFEVSLPEGDKVTLGRGDEFLPSLDRAERMLDEELASVGGSQLERKRYSLAIHYRRIDTDRVPEVEAVVDKVLSRVDGLKKTWGKKVFELRPDIEWDKGRALRWLIEQIDMDLSRYTPVYIGDDLTDEDAFESLAESGVSIVVSEESDKATAAEYRLSDTSEVESFLDTLAERLEQESRS
jgi:alpha,alpha-trehalase